MAVQSFYSSSWYRVAELKPRLRGHVRIHRHEYRDEVWYILEEPASGQFHRFSPAAQHVIGLMDGTRTVQEIWDIATARFGDDAPTQDEVIQFLGQLHAANVLQAGVSPDDEELSRRRGKVQRSKWLQRVISPLALRFPLLDPDRYLERLLPLVRPLFGWFGALLWVAVVGWGVVTAAVHWTELSGNFLDRVFTAQNLFVLWLAYPVVKAIHEFGHAFATKVWGGEVHEMGIMLLVLMPIPYVEASSASAFQEKHRRVVVGAAGIMVELFLAALALFVWINVEPGLVRTVAYNVALIGSISTVFFNGNPLLRFDGYYILADAIEVPNLATRSQRYLGYLFQRYAFGVQDAKSPASARGERAWFVIYGLASFAYRMFIMFAVILLIATKLFFVGVLLAIWAVLTQILWPISKTFRFLFTNPMLERRRARALTVSAIALVTVYVGLFLLPVPLWTRAEGVVWIPEQAHVRAGADGFVRRMLVPDGAHVAQGQPLVESADPFLKTQVRLLEARGRELSARLTAQQFEDQAQAQVIEQERREVQAELDRARERLAALVVRSPADGTFVAPGAEDLLNLFFHRGELIGYVVSDDAITVRAVIRQEDVGLVRKRTRVVQARLDDFAGESQQAEILREVPEATDKLPHRALGANGGGSFAVDPKDPDGVRTLERVFQVELLLPDAKLSEHMGGRVLVRFDHGYEPLAFQWYRKLRQLLLSRFSV